MNCWIRTLNADSSQRWEIFHNVKGTVHFWYPASHYNPNLPITVATVASNYVVGEVFSHIFFDGSENAVAYVSRTLTTGEKNYSQVEKESLAIVFAFKKS